MALVTLQIIEGLERGRIFADLPTPVTIGREEDNTLSLKDEQISRLHVKLQEEDGRVILTDLCSTNGTRVNGHPVQMRVLQTGDLLAIGRCLLIYGSLQDLDVQTPQQAESDFLPPGFGEKTISVTPDSVSDSESFQDHWMKQPGDLFPHGPPDPPADLRPIQKADISDFLSYLHAEIGTVLQSLKEVPPEEDSDRGEIQIDWDSWKRLLKLEMDLAIYLRKISEPGRESESDS